MGEMGGEMGRPELRGLLRSERNRAVQADAFPDVCPPHGYPMTAPGEKLNWLPPEDCRWVRSGAEDNLVFSRSPLDVVDYQELDLHLSAIQFQSKLVPKGGKQVGSRRRGRVRDRGRGC